jgi:hypothetical protein
MILRFDLRNDLKVEVRQIGTAFAALPDTLCGAAAQHIPQRPAEAPAGSAFARAVAPLSEPERDALLAGNMPRFLRQVLPATLTAGLADGQPVRLTLCVLSDDLSLGSDNDFLLVPMGLDTALAVAARFGFVLPTRRIVDLIYREAAVRLRPQPLPAGDTMRSTGYYSCAATRWCRHSATAWAAGPAR